jgi:hypothetical protein
MLRDRGLAPGRLDDGLAFFGQVLCQSGTDCAVSPDNECYGTGNSLNSLKDNYLSFGATERQKVVRHRVEARMDNLVVHGKDEDVAEKVGQEVPQTLVVLTVNVSFPALRRSMRLGLDGRRAQDTDPVIRHRGTDIAQETLFLFRGNMFQYVQTIGPVERAFDRPFKDIMDQAAELPTFVHPAESVLHKNRVKIDGRQILDFLQDDPRAKGVGAPYLKDVLASTQHLGDKLVPGEHENQVFGVFVPGVAAHEAQLCQPLPVS